MTDLAALERAFASALVARDVDDADVSALDGAPERVRARLGLYRGNVQANAVKALTSAHPVVAKLVGDDFMGGVARAFAAATPSTSGDLNEYGEGFADFIATFAPAAELPYLFDVARLDWRVHRVHYAADVAPLDLEKLAAVAPQRMGELRFALNPACSVVESRWPLARLWEIHQHDYEGAFDVDWDAGGGALLVERPHWRVRVRALDTAGAAFLGACRDDASLADALARAQAVDGAFALEPRLAEWVKARVIVDLALPRT
jgi:uncharacterized protein